jgi:predicted nucleotidyltransferase
MEIEESRDAVRLKTYCYALRPTLALLWIRGRGEPPPMDLPQLLESAAVSADLRDAVAVLLRQKRTAGEKATTPRIRVLDAFIGGELAESVERPPPSDRAAVLARADSLFASLLGLSSLS